MKGLYFYKLSSPYQEDITKDCKLTINEIDHNFVTLKNSDIKDIIYDEENGLLTLTQNDGEQLIAKIDLSHYTKDFNVFWDEEKTALIFQYDGKEVIIDEFISELVDNSITNIVEEIISQTITDNTLVGVGVGDDPLRINPVEIPGTYKAVECVIDKTKGEFLPNEEKIQKGERYLTYEKRHLYGKLYNYESIKKINEDLKNGWRVPTKEDWDNMLNAIELCDIDRNHQSKICNIKSGKYAGKFLKHKNYWKINDGNDELFLCDDNCITCEGDEPKYNPLLTNGVDTYGMSMLPAGYGDSHGTLNYMGLYGEFWTMTETERSDVYTKRFAYNSSAIEQIAESPKALCSLRLVKDYTGNNFKGVETINGMTYHSVLIPSMNTEHKYSIWLASNVAFAQERYNAVEPKNDENMVIEDCVYYINEWDGFQWIKKQLIDGDSLVIKVGPDGYNNREYQLIEGELINIKVDIEAKVQEGIIEYKELINQQVKECTENVSLLSGDVKSLENRVVKNEEVIVNTANELHDITSKHDKNIKELHNEDIVIYQQLNNLSGFTHNVVDIIKENEKIVSYALNELHDEISQHTQDINELQIEKIAIKEGEGNQEQLIKKTYQLIGKSGTTLGDIITIEENMANETYVSKDIPVVGGPLADLVSVTTTEIKAGTNIQDLLFTLFCQEKYPENPRFNNGSISATINQPTFTVYQASTTSVITNNKEVEAGTNIDIAALISPKTTYTITPSTWSGFDFGYSVQNDNTKDGDGNPSNLNNTTPTQKSAYVLKRTFSGFDNKISTQTATNNYDNAQVKVNQLTNVTVADGNNIITSNVTGATFQTTFDDDILSYYACSNLGNTTSEQKVDGNAHTKTTNTPSNSYSVTIKGMRYSFIGTFDNTNFIPTSESVRNLNKYAFSKTNTTKVTAPAGKKCVVIAYPKQWGKLTKIEDVNAIGALIQDNFDLEEINVHGANNYKTVAYYVYVLKSGVTLGAIDYNLYF